MKTWEMIKELTENPDKGFTRKSDGLHIKTNEYGELVCDSGYQILRLYHDWEEIKKPVDFMTAVASGKKILFPDLCVEEEYLPLDVLLKEIASNYYVTEIITAITNGKFYTED